MSRVVSVVSRRSVLGLAATSLLACDRVSTQDQAPAAPMSEEDRALKHKFRGLDGGQLRVDSLFEVTGLNIFDENGDVFFVAASMIPPRGNYIGSYGAEFGVPKFLRVEWRDRYLTAHDPPEPPPPGHRDRAFRGGTLLGNHTVPVASRIPDALLDDLRKNGGGFRLKIRIHEDGPLIGWDIQRAVGSASDGSAFHHAGGDFQEARGFIKFKGEARAFIKPGENYVIDQGWAKGWYIHPKTKERIETDF